ncbi:hypothetical protein HK097_011534, partial [Rhizophlyctis rosea]
MLQVDRTSHAFDAIDISPPANVSEHQAGVDEASPSVSLSIVDDTSEHNQISKSEESAALTINLPTSKPVLITTTSESANIHPPLSPLRLQPRKPSLALSSTSSTSAPEPSTQTLTSLQRANQLSHGIIEENYAPVYDIVSTWEFYAQANSPSVSRSATPTYYLSMDREGGVVVVKDDALAEGVSSNGNGLDVIGEDSGVGLLDAAEDNSSPTPQFTTPQPQSPTTPQTSDPFSLPQIDTTPLFPIDLTTSSFLPSPDPATIVSQPPITVRKFHLPIAKHKYFESLLVQLDDKSVRGKMDPGWVEKLEEFRRSGTLKLEDMPERERRILEGVADGDGEGEVVVADEEKEDDEEVRDDAREVQEADDAPAERNGIIEDVSSADLQVAPVAGRNREESQSGVSLLMDYYTPDSAEQESYGTLT